MHPLFFVSTLWAILFSSFANVDKIKRLVISLLPLLVMTATRVNWLPDDSSYEVLWDVEHYMDFKQYIAYAQDRKFEPGFWLIEQLPFNMTTLLISSLYIVAIIVFCVTFVPDNYYSVFLAFSIYNAQFCSSISARRSCVVISLFLIAMCLKLHRKNYYAILVILLSGLFHRTGYFLLPLALIPLDFAKKHLKVLFVSTVVIIGLVVAVPSFFNNFLNDALEDSSFSSYTYYLEAKDHSIGHYVMQFFNIGLLYLCIYIYKMCDSDSDKYSLLLLITVVSLCLSILPDIGIGRIKAYIAFLKFAFICYTIHITRESAEKKLANLMTLGFIVFAIYDYSWFLGAIKSYNGSFINYESWIIN